ncbi:MAG: helix-hairpin-helix domain-containing protein [Candidatus Heimdallarchaeota archaeon]|nr:helix-hairpin-helix domain-containing protein [Candidatus Heimdallarchaeota archaeon]
MSSRPQRRSLIGSYRYSVVIKPDENEFSEQMKGVLELYDGKHVAQTHKYSSFDQLATTIINFWEKMLGSEVNVHRFANWLAEYFSDVGVTNINFYQLIEIVRNLGKGVSLHSSGLKVREAKVVLDPLEISSKKRKEMTTDVESMISPVTKTVKPSEMFKEEEKVLAYIPVIQPETVAKEEEEPAEAPPVNSLLKPSEVIKKRDTIFEGEVPRTEAPKKVFGDPVVTKPTPKIEKEVKPVGSLLRPAQYLKKKETIDVISDAIVKPSQISPERKINQLRTSSKTDQSVQEMVHSQKKVVIQKLTRPSEGLLKPSEYLKDKETAIEKIEHLKKPSEAIKADSDAFIAPVRRIDPDLMLIPAPPGSKGKKIGKRPVDSKPSVNKNETLPFEIEVIDDREFEQKDVKPSKEKKQELYILGIAGVGEKTVMLLKDGGIEKLEQLAASSPEELSKIRGIGITSARKLINGAQSLLKKQV